MNFPPHLTTQDKGLNPMTSVVVLIVQVKVSYRIFTDLSLGI